MLERLSKPAGAGFVGAMAAGKSTGMSRMRPTSSAADRGPDAPAPASCLACGFGWHGPAMVHGLKLLGTCPRCNGELRFSSTAQGLGEDDATAGTAAEPHLALGLPRAPRR